MDEPRLLMHTVKFRRNDQTSISLTYAISSAIEELLMLAGMRFTEGGNASEPGKNPGPVSDGQTLCYAIPDWFFLTIYGK